MSVFPSSPTMKQKRIRVRACRRSESSVPPAIKNHFIRVRIFLFVSFFMSNYFRMKFVTVATPSLLSIIYPVIKRSSDPRPKSFIRVKIYINYICFWKHTFSSMPCATCQNLYRRRNPKTMKARTSEVNLVAMAGRMYKVY